MAERPTVYVVKAALADPRARTFVLAAQKTMYGGKHIAPGDAVFLFDSENEGGSGLAARGVVTAARATPRRRGVTRQTPRVDITVTRKAPAKTPLGRAALKPFRGAAGPQGELDFKLYRQATNKIVGVSAATGAWLDGFF
ncbi:MAG TPA: hypothetical protein VHZ78_01315 [Rhizomicrobium sp.]|jgi:hypothetical protein|nr:hypothetical protein [Rhizomicrobium sp.]